MSDEQESDDYRAQMRRVREQRAENTREHYLAKMRRRLGMKPKQMSEADELAAVEARCTCADGVTCDSCKAWAKRMLAIATGKASGA